MSNMISFNRFGKLHWLMRGKDYFIIAVKRRDGSVGYGFPHKTKPHALWIMGHIEQHYGVTPIYLLKVKFK